MNFFRGVDILRPMITPTEHRELIGQHVMMVREAEGLRPRDFCRRLGMTPQALWNIETGRAYPSPLMMIKLCAEFGVTMDFLYRGIKAGLPASLAQRLGEIAERSFDDLLRSRKQPVAGRKKTTESSQ